MTLIIRSLYLNYLTNQVSNDYELIVVYDHPYLTVFSCPPSHPIRGKCLHTFDCFHFICTEIAAISTLAGLILIPILGISPLAITGQLVANAIFGLGLFASANFYSYVLVTIVIKLSAYNRLILTISYRWPFNV